MRIRTVSIGIVVIAALIIAGCADLKNQIPNPVTPTSIVHSTGWVDTSGHGAGHGLALQQQNWNATSCKSCHGGSYSGGTSGVSCFTCHPAAPHDALFGADSTKHGSYLKAKQWVATECQLCHGATYQSGNVNIACYSCHASFPHEVKFNGTITGHQTYLQTASYNAKECQKCHGPAYGGGGVSVSCFTCHSAYPHDVTFGSTATTAHKQYIINNGLLTAGCKDCHGSDYTGAGVNAKNCLASGCHVTSTGVAKSPEACNTCHGQFRGAASDTASWAPPRALNGDTLTTSKGVGAHQKHLHPVITLAAPSVMCAACHKVPSTPSAAGHFDATPGAEVALTGLANLTTNGVTPNAVYSSSTGKCSNTFCHGTWTLPAAGSEYAFIYTGTSMQGASASPAWTGGSNEAKCGSCHGLPPAGHDDTYGACSGCHGRVVDANNNIIDKSKHMNGKVDVFAKQLNFR
jgi:predicted CxxxxCH...CXXCH cytochrome family protein